MGGAREGWRWGDEGREAEYSGAIHHAFEAPAVDEDAGRTDTLGAGFVLWHRDRDGLPGDDDDEQEEEEEEEGWGAAAFTLNGEEEEWEEGDVEEEEEEEGQHFVLSEEWIARFAHTEAARQLRDKERRREARQRRERPKVAAALAAEQRVEAMLAARRAAEQRKQRQQHGDDGRRDDQRGAGQENSTAGGNIYRGDNEDENDDVDAMRLYGVEGAEIIARLEARLNAEYDALIDLKAPPYWPCEPLR